MAAAIVEIGNRTLNPTSKKGFSNSNRLLKYTFNNPTSSNQVFIIS